MSGTEEGVELIVKQKNAEIIRLENELNSLRSAGLPKVFEVLESIQEHLKKIENVLKHIWHTLQHQGRIAKLGRG